MSNKNLDGLKNGERISMDTSPVKSLYSCSISLGLVVGRTNGTLD